jgi:hypothetical protein
VGGTATTARDAKETTPTRKVCGTFWRKASAAALAAPSRVGLTSVAFIDRDVSMASSTVASSRGTETVACGRATPTTIAASATRRIASGRCRRQPGERSTTPGSSAGLPKRAAYDRRRRSRRT